MKADEGRRRSGPIQVGVIEDHPLYRDAVARVLNEAPDIELVAVADSVARALRAATEPDPRAGGIPSTKGVL